MSTRTWHTRQVYRCVNTQCECEVVILQLPHPGRVTVSLPACCACGAPMQLLQNPPP